MPRLWWLVAIVLSAFSSIVEGQALANRPETDGPAPGFVLETWTVRDGLPVNSITRIHQSKSGYIWLATFDGLVRFDGVRFTVFNMGNSQGLPNNRIVDLKEEKDGALLLTTELNQLVRFKDGRFTQLKEPAPVQQQPELIARRADGKIWSSNGTGIFLDGRLAYRRTEGSGFSTLIRTIAVDREGSLWFGTIAGGLNQLKPALFTMYGLSEGRGDNNLYSVTPASAGGVWAGTWTANIISHVDTAGRVTSFGGEHGVNSKVISLYDDVRRHRLIAGDRVCELPAIRCRLLTPSPIQVNAIDEDADGVLWFGTTEGLFRLDGTRWQSLKEIAGSPKRTVRAFARANDGSLWMATNGDGVFRFDGKNFSAVTTRDGLPSDVVRALYLDKDGWLWIGTEGNGIARLNPRDWAKPNAKGRIANIRSTNGLFDDGIHTILEDDHGRMWMSTNRGIFWVLRRDLVDFADGRVPRVRSTGYTERNGLRNREANGGSQPAATRTADGRLWFATQDGLAMVDPRTIGNNAVPPNVVVEQVIAGGTPIIADGKSIEIDPARRDLRIEFTALSFLAPENIRFRYRLRPYDKDWIDGDTRRSATYTRVPPGNYTFEVIASTGGDVWTVRPASLSLDVTPRFIETGTFKLVVLLGVALLIWAGIRLRIARLRKLADDLQQRVNDRTRELREREALLAEQNAQLEIQADQLQELDRAKTRFFANVSHELRTPLTLTIGPLEEARAQLADSNHGTVSRIDMALRNSRRLFRLVNQILDVSKLESGGTKLRASPGDLMEFVRGIASAFAGVAERKGIAFKVEGPEASADVWFDPDALEKVIANLLSNAFKFTPERGGILVSVEVGEDLARVRVSDSGPGIPAEHLPHIFDRFYQVDETNTRAQPGTGIGLALARELAELHAGKLEVESGSGGGATFTLSLPMGRSHLSDDQITAVDRPRQSVVPEVDIETPANSSNGTHVLSDDATTLLVVDDNADLRSYVRSRFESRYRIIEASDGADAIRKAREVIPDLVISDVMMPGTDGHALVAALRESEETDFIPVILLTAQGESGQKIAGLERGADDYIVKPFDMRELEVRVENLIASRRKLRERYAVGQVELKSSPDGLSASDKAFVERLKAAVEAGLNDPEFGVGELAKAVFQDRSHLFRRTRELLGESPSDLLRRVRLERAASLLRQSDGSVAEVAYAAGFNSVSNFCRVFRAAYGATPSEFREGKSASITS